MGCGHTQPSAIAGNSATPAAYWTGLMGQFQADAIRALGWAQLIQGHACGLVPADHLAYGYMQAAMVTTATTSIVNLQPGSQITGRNAPTTPPEIPTRRNAGRHAAHLGHRHQHRQPHLLAAGAGDLLGRHRRGRLPVVLYLPD